MRILLDQNLPLGLRQFLNPHTVMTADEEGWSEFLNGDLLRVAEEHGFDLLLTADQSLSYQQNLMGRRLAIGVLTTNHWPSVRSSAGAIAAAVDTCRVGDFFIVKVPRLPS